MLDADRRRPTVVLGASGFIGSWLVDAFSGTGRPVRAVSRRTFKPRPAPCVVGRHARTIAAQPLTVLNADLTRFEAVASVCGDADLIVIVVVDRSTGSWRVGDDLDARQLTVGLPTSIIDVARGADEPPTIVLAGTITQSSGHAPSRYEQLKHEAEGIVLDAALRGDVRATCLRLPTVYGPPRSETGTDHGVVSTVIRQGLSGKPISMWHDGSPVRDLLYVIDAATAFVAAADTIEALNGRAWEIGHGRGPSIGELFDAVATGVARSTGRARVAVEQRDPPDQAVANDVRDAISDPAPFRDRTGWVPQVPWPIGLANTIEDAVASSSSEEATT